MSEQFGKLAIAKPGKKEEKFDATPPAAKKTFVESSSIFDSPEAIVKLLEQCAGDLDKYVASFDSRIGDKNYILSRSLFRLSAPNNEAQMQQWESMIKCYKQARHLSKEREAFEALGLMPIPNSKELEKWTTTQWHNFATFWLGDLREESKSKAKKAAPVVSDPAVAALVKILNDRKAEKEMPDFFADEVPPMADEFEDD